MFGIQKINKEYVNWNSSFETVREITDLGSGCSDHRERHYVPSGISTHYYLQSSLASKSNLNLATNVKEIK